MLGNTNTFAFPATSLPGAFSFATSSETAASNWNSPSSAKSGAFSFASFTASCIFGTDFKNLSSFPEPFVEKESIATLGSIPVIAFAVFAEAIAISASSSEFGSILIAQSANKATPSLMYGFPPSGATIIKAEETVFMPGAVFIT